jgi:shikimate kinase
MDADHNFFLVGLMGAGKTTVGRALARRLQLTFVDSDQEIEARTGVRIATIFELEGEAGFRLREEEVIAQLVRRQGIVLATGGGAVLNPTTRERLRRHGTVIYLRASAEDLWHRTRHDRSRPLLQTADPKARLQQLYDQRDPLYRETAHIVIDTAHQSVQRLVNQLETEIARQQPHENPDC